MVGLLFSARSRAQTPVTNGSPDDFQTALDQVISNGGGTIVVTQPIGIDSDTSSFDGQSIVTVSGGNTNSIFSVTNSGNLTLANFTIANGLSTNKGGAIFVDSSSSLTLSNCIFSNNIALGASGLSASTNSSTNTPTIGANGGGGTAGDSVSGGAIYNLGSLFVFYCQFLSNSATGGSGGDGAPGVTGLTTGGNGGRGGNGGNALGGGIYDAGTGSVISNSTFAQNLARGGTAGSGGAGGGGLFSGVAASGGTGGNAGGAGLYTSDSNCIIWACTFANNSAQGGNSADGGTSSGGLGQPGRNGGSAFGGGIDNVGSLNMTNSTFFENAAAGGSGGNGGNGGGAGNGGHGGNAVGGGLYNAGSAFVVSCTFSKGSVIGGTNGFAGSGVIGGSTGSPGASRGGNIANVASRKKGSFTLADSIVGKTLAGKAGYGRIIDGGFNISADNSIPFKRARRGGTSLMKTDPLPGDIDLADNGGPTETIALPTNSLAIDFINPAIDTNAPLDVDQRGTHRPIQVFSNDWNDAGAFELDPNAISIIKQPQSTNVPVGSNATFSVTAQSAQPLGYQWYFNASNLPPSALTDPSNILSGETSNVLAITDVQSTNQGFYVVVVTNAFDSATSKVASLTITTPPVIAGITITPTNGDVTLGSNATISVTVSGALPLVYRWFFFAQTNSTTNALSNTGNISGVTSNTLSITNFQATNSGNYFVIVTNAAGSATSQVTLLTSMIPTNSPPIITFTSQTPTNGVVTQSSNATMSVTVISPSNAPVGYQWYFSQAGSGVTNALTDNPGNFPGNVIGSTSNVLTVTNFDFNQGRNDGMYFVIVTNSFGSTTSSVFTLTVSSIAPSPVVFLDKSLQLSGQVSLASPASFCPEPENVNTRGGKYQSGVCPQPSPAALQNADAPGSTPRGSWSQRARRATSELSSCGLRTVDSRLASSRNRRCRSSLGIFERRSTA